MPELTQLLLRLESTLQELKLHKASVDSKSLTIGASRLFKQNPLLPGIILLEANRFAGMISRKRFFEQLSRPYGLELFSKKPIRLFYQFVQTDILVLPGDTSILVAAQKSLQRRPELLYEPIVVQTQIHEYRLLDVHQLLLTHLQIHKLALSTLRHSQQALEEEKELAQITLHSIGDAVITTDETGLVRSLNPVAEKLTGWQATEAKGVPLSQVFQIVDDSTGQPVPNPVELVLQGRNTSRIAKQARLVSRTGIQFAIDNSASPILARDGEIIGAVLVFRDVTQERDLARQLSWQASHDALTGLMNRREFEQHLEQACSSTKTSEQTHVLCCMDLDRFKIVNDTCGHLAGDELLRQISTLLQNWVRKTDVLARTGGDEFRLLLRNCSLEQGLLVAQEIRQSIQDFRLVWQDKTFAIGVSIGLSLIDEETSGSTSALSEADAACYRAKKQGRNRVEVYERNHDWVTLSSRGSWLTQITRALEEDRFRLYRQPIAPVVSSSKRVEHYEVLLRMLDETDTLVSPDAFISTAERYNLMPAIDRWVIRTLFASQSGHYRNVWDHYQQASLPSDYLYAINLSGASINEGSLIDFIREQLTLHQIPPQLVCFEITETVAIANLNKAAQVIRELKQLGCHFALDDFGSGMSSFGYLKNLPVDYLKIDGSFVKEIANDVVASAMVEAINHIGRVMKLKTIAECVEDEATLAKVRAIGLDYAQGYGIARPHPLQQWNEVVEPDTMTEATKLIQPDRGSGVILHQTR